MRGTCKMRFSPLFRTLCQYVNPVISTSEVVQRRQKLVSLLGTFVSKHSNTASKHVLIFPSSDVQYMAYHVPYTFHQDSRFLYLTKFNHSNAILTISVDVQPSVASSDPMVTYTEDFFIETRDERSLIWDGPAVNPEESTEITGVQSISNLTEFPQFLESLNPNVTLWYAPLARNDPENRAPNRIAFNHFVQFCQKSNKRKDQIQNPNFLIDLLRYIKSPQEILLLQTAASATANCMLRCMAESHPGINESLFQGYLELEARKQGALLGYPPVVAGGSRALTIHYLSNRQPIFDGDLVLIDVGCQIDGYTGDLTRTWPINGHYSAIQLILHDILEEVQIRCSKLANCDHSLQDVHHLMLRELERHLVAERIIPSNAAKELVQLICPHSVGHFLGLDVHDTPSISQSRRFEPGVVFPLEPGIYIRPTFKKYGIPAEFLGYGLRLEDDFVISSAGSAVRLTDRLPTNAKDIEKIIGKSDNLCEKVTSATFKNHPQ